jgi:DNA ligase-1
VASFDDFAAICEALAQTSSRLQIAELVAEFIAQLSLDEAEIAARFMVGKVVEQGAEKRLQVSGRAVWRVVAELTGGEDQSEDIFASAVDFGEAIERLLRLRRVEPPPHLTLGEVAARMQEIAATEGRNSRGRKLAALRELFERASAREGKYLTKILIGEMRHGLSDGLMLEAIARMAGRPVAEVRRAHMLEPDLGRLVRGWRTPAVLAPARGDGGSAGGAEPTTAGPIPAAEIAASSGAGDAAAAPPLSLPLRSRPLRPMLAAAAPNIAEAFRILNGNLALEHKLDGARVQIHKQGTDVRIFSRRLNEITASLPEVVEMASRIGPHQAILDGEVIAIDRTGRAIAFQELMRRFGRVREIERLREEQPVRLFLFDVMSLGDRLLIDDPYRERYERLVEMTAAAGLEVAPRIIPRSLGEAEQFYVRALAEGREGVMAKELMSLYTPGARGRGWLKIKPARTLDLVIVAAEWGYGRRHGWLSNYHLAARDEAAGGFAEVGKTFKGLTDADFEQMTERLIAIKTGESHGIVSVRPEVVVEVAYSDIQRSPRYRGGMALRFARIVGVRSDKSAEEADTLTAIAAALDRQLVKPIGT